MVNYPTRNMAINRAINRSKGFTLVELLIVVVILGILASIAIPAYQDSVMSSKRGAVQSDLMSFANAMERYFTENGTYVGATAAGVYYTQSPTTGGAANYTLSVSSATASTYTLTATATGTMAGDGDFTLTNTGARTYGGSAGWSLE